MASLAAKSVRIIRKDRPTDCRLLVYESTSMNVGMIISFPLIRGRGVAEFRLQNSDDFTFRVQKKRLGFLELALVSTNFSTNAPPPHPARRRGSKCSLYFSNFHLNFRCYTCGAPNLRLYWPQRFPY